MVTEQIPVWAWAIMVLIVQGIFGLVVKRLLEAVDQNTQELTKLRVQLPTVYATKEENREHHREDQRSFERQDRELAHLRERVTAIDGTVRDAREALGGA